MGLIFKKHQRFKLVSAAHLFLIKGPRILMTRRFKTGYEDGNYGVPSGHLDGGEQATAAMFREAWEEIGIEISPADLTCVHTMHRNACSHGSERIDFFFLCKSWTGEPRIKEPDKCDDLIWSFLWLLPDNTIPYIRQAIEKYYKERENYSEFGW